MRIIRKKITLNDLIIPGLVLVMIYILIKDVIARYLISECNRVSVGTLVETYYKRTGRFGIVQLNYKGRTITLDHESIGDPKSYYTVGKKYFVKISCEDDSVSRIDWKTPVPDSLSNSPTNGWPSEEIYPN